VSDLPDDFGGMVDSGMVDNGIVVLHG